MAEEKIENKEEKKIEIKEEKKTAGTEKKQNPMQEIQIEKIVLSCGAVGDELEKSAKLLKLISGMSATKTTSRKRIPAFDIRPGLEIGCKVTLRGEKAEKLLKRLLETVGNKINEKQFTDGGFSFGIAEYIEIPEMEYQRDIGMLGLNVSVAFVRKGKRVIVKKIKKGKLPKKQRVTKQEIINFMKTKFKINQEEEEE